jgi:N6-adenosine-specific RNA methylase IME4
MKRIVGSTAQRRTVHVHSRSCSFTELVLFGVRGSMRTLQPGRTQVNLLSSRKREHSRKPDEIYDLVEACSPGPYLELFARFRRAGWDQWGNEDVEENSFHGVAKRNGHVDPEMRLFESPRGYGRRIRQDVLAGRV